jgi:flagellar assembly factor FliW
MKDLFDNLKFSEQDIITFENGIPGFEDKKHFVIVTVPEHEPFKWLYCIDDRVLRFALINPLLFYPDYNPKVNKADLSSLELELKEDVLMFCIVTLAEKIKDSTANLIGPVFINTKNMKGKQVVIDDNRYSTREPIIR